MNIRWLYIFSFLLISTSCFAQDTSPMEMGKHQLFVSTDLTGIVALPLSTIIIKKEKSHYRLLSDVQYVYDEVLTINVVGGILHHKSDLIKTNFSKYTSNAEFVQILLGAIPFEREKFRFLVGAGMTFGRLDQTGTIEIGDDFFDPYLRELSLDERFIGWITYMNFDFKFDSRWSLLFDTRMQAINVANMPSIQAIHSNPGAGLSWRHNRKSAFGTDISIRLKYKLFDSNYKRQTTK